jgi:sugar lactone lactonase YvrE
MKSKKTLPFTFQLFICSLAILAFTGCSKSGVEPNNNNSNNPALANLPGQTYTLAGNSTQGLKNGLRLEAEFNNPNGIAVDATGNLYVTDQANNVIRKITPDGTVSTFAGSGIAGNADGAANIASFNNPIGIAIDASNNIFIADLGNNIIRKVTQDGTVSTWAGSGTIGFNDGPGKSATFNGPDAITIDHSGNLYVSDNHNTIRKISPTQDVTTFAGNVHTSPGFANGTGIEANFNLTVSLAIDGADNIYVADYSDNMIRKITPGGVVTTLAGQLNSGSQNGSASATTFNKPLGVASDAAGNVYVADNGNSLIRKIAVSGEVTTLAGSGAVGAVNGNNLQASFNDLHGIAVDAKGNVYVGDEQNNRIRKIIPAVK